MIGSVVLVYIIFFGIPRVASPPPKTNRSRCTTYEIFFYGNLIHVQPEIYYIGGYGHFTIFQSFSHIGLGRL